MNYCERERESEFEREIKISLPQNTTAERFVFSSFFHLFTNTNTKSVGSKVP